MLSDARSIISDAAQKAGEVGTRGVVARSQYATTRVLYHFTQFAVGCDP